MKETTLATIAILISGAALAMSGAAFGLALGHRNAVESVRDELDAHLESLEPQRPIIRPNRRPGDMGAIGSEAVVE